MEQKNRVDSFEKFLEWNKSLPLSARTVHKESTKVLVFPSSLYVEAGQTKFGGAAGFYSAMKGAVSSLPFNAADRLEGIQTRWWMARELSRYLLLETHPEHYEAMPVEVMKTLTCGWALPAPPTHFLRINKQDRTQVDFVASVDDGLRDKVTTMSFGRYVNKFFSWLMPHSVQEIERMFRSHVSDDYDVFMGGEAIIKYYNNGPHSCMVFPRHKWGDVENHVLMAYDAPGWGIAIIAKDEKKSSASARSLVWIDPNNEKNKYYIRVYGDGVLEKRLVKAGFVNRVPDRAPLKYIPDVYGNSKTNILLPYFDSTRNNSGNDGGYIFTEMERPWMLSPTEWSKLHSVAAMRPYLIRHAHTTLSTPHVRFHGFRCVHCSVRLATEEASSLKPASNGSVCNTCFNEQDYVSCSVNGAVVYKPRCQTVFVRRVKRYVSSDKVSMAAIGLVLLDPVYYGDNEYDVNSIGMVKKENRGHWLRKDTAAILSMNHTNSGVLTSYVNMLDNAWDPSKKLIRLASRTPGETLYADKSLQHLLVDTITNRKILPGVHKGYAFQADNIGRATGSRNVQQVFSVFGANRFNAGPYTNWSKALLSSMATKLHPLEAAICADKLLSAVPSSHSFVDCVINVKYQLSDWYVPGVHSNSPTVQASEFFAGSVQQFSYDYLCVVLKLLLRKQVDETFFAEFQKLYKKELTDADRNAIIGLRTIWLQIHDAWVALKEAKPAKKEPAKKLLPSTTDCE